MTKKELEVRAELKGKILVPISEDEPLAVGDFLEWLDGAFTDIVQGSYFVGKTAKGEGLKTVHRMVDMYDEKFCGECNQYGLKCIC